MDVELDLDTLLDLLVKGVPMYEADDDFIEYLREVTYLDASSVEVDEMVAAWDEWVLENVE